MNGDTIYVCVSPNGGGAFTYTSIVSFFVAHDDARIVIVGLENEKTLTSSDTCELVVTHLRQLRELHAAPLQLLIEDNLGNVAQEIAEAVIAAHIDRVVIAQQASGRYGVRVTKSIRREQEARLIAMREHDTFSYDARCIQSRPDVRVFFEAQLAAVGKPIEHPPVRHYDDIVLALGLGMHQL